MKLTYAQLNDMFENSTWDADFDVVLKDSKEFGKDFGTGVYCKPESSQDVYDAIEKAESDMFTKVFLFVEMFPELKLVA